MLANLTAKNQLTLPKAVTAVVTTPKTIVACRPHSHTIPSPSPSRMYG